MKQTHVRRDVILACVIALGIGTRAWGRERPLAATHGADSRLSMARYYAGSIFNIGEFPGTLVRLSCDSKGSTNATAPGDQPGYDYALIVDGDDVIHPLFPGTDEVRRELSSGGLQGTDVAVRGKYYPNTGAILVSHIVVATSGAVRKDEASKHQTSGSAVGLNTAPDRFRLARCASD